MPLDIQDLPLQDSLRPSLPSRRPSPMDPHSYSNLDRPLNVTDALTYLDAVKVQFQDKPDVYNHFLDIMKEFKNEQIDTPGVIKRVSHLFHGHPSLIQGFNTFLPVGYRIECSMDPQDAGFITVTTPSGTTLQTTNGGPGRALSWSTAPSAPHPRHEPTSGYFGPNDHGAHAPPPAPSPEPPIHYGMDGQAIEPAVQYVQKIKQRCDADTYRQFLDILSRYHHKPDTIDEEEVSRQIARLFKDAPDLRADFRVFMPDRSQQLMDDVPSHARDREKNRRTKLDAAASSMNANPQPAPSQKRKRKAPEKEREREKEPTPAKVVPPPSKKTKHAAPAQDLTPLSYNQKHVVASNAAAPAAVPPSPRRPHHTLPASHHPQQHPQSSIRTAPVHPADDTHFFDRVKHALDNRDLYNEFLKLVNLFAQDYIDTARLVKESRNFLGNTELYKQFCEILGWDENKEREHFLKEQNERSGWAKPAIVGLPERPGRVDLSEKYGSYRRVSASMANVACSGRDEMCRSVLNDEWVSLPSWTSEDSGFIFHRKNIYEEALHRSEEERHEYDFHIEAIVRTIAMLEPINHKIASLSSPEDRAAFKLKPNLGGSWKAIHQRVIKKIYGREVGLEVVSAMQEQPAHAIPVVLARLKQKEEEWKRAQREWNKVWRDVDARNYLKSLDCQAIMWKVKEKKALGLKSLVHEIETAREEQHSKRAALVDRSFERTRPRYQLAFDFGGDEGEGEEREKGKEKEKEKERGNQVMGILQDVVKLIFSFMDRTQGQLSALERKRIENFLRHFVPLFFALSDVEFNAGLVHQDTVVESENEAASEAGEDTESASIPPAPPASSANGKGRNGRKHQSNHSSGGDLRKKLLKSEQAKSTSGRKTRGGGSPAVSRFASPVVFGGAGAGAQPEGENGVGLGGEMVFVLPHGAAKRSTKINNVFFTNTTFYALMRLMETLYSRLRLFKNLSAELARKAEEKAAASISKSEGGAPPAVDKKYHYDILLGQCEALFMNELEQNVFEDQTRAVFGYKHAYKIFTVDKVIGAIIKQAQNVIADPKSQELLELLKRERSLMAPTTQDRTNYRHQVENILGPDDNVFRIDWLSESKTMTIQLIGRDDATFDDSEALSGRWQNYIDAYVSGDATEGILHSRVRRPYLRRNLPAGVPDAQLDVSSQDGLEIRVCVRTYRLFYVPKTEDLMWKHMSKEETGKHAKHLKTRNGLRRKWLESGVDRLREAVGQGEGGDVQTQSGTEAEGVKEGATAPISSEVTAPASTTS